MRGWKTDRLQINTTQGGWVIIVDDEPKKVVGSVVEALKLVKEMEDELREETASV